MGSNYFGEQPDYYGNINERGGGLLSSSSSSRKGKKNGSDKPKQPQRGLGVAQLEKIRLHSQLGCAYLPSAHTNPYASNLFQEDIRLQTPNCSSPTSYNNGFLQGHHGVMMGMPTDFDRENITHGDNAARWHQANAGYRTQQYFVEPSMTTSFLEPGMQGSLNKKNKKKKKKELMDFMGASNQNSESKCTQDIDLELRLSL
ncbi:hypothetical protein OROMI_018859 [Orobanche minor]